MDAEDPGIFIISRERDSCITAYVVFKGWCGYGGEVGTRGLEHKSTKTMGSKRKPKLGFVDIS